MSRVKSLQEITEVVCNISSCTRSNTLYKVGERYYTCSYGSTIDTCRDESITEVNPSKFYLEYLLLQERSYSYKLQMLKEEVCTLTSSIPEVRTLIKTLRSKIEKENK